MMRFRDADDQKSGSVWEQNLEYEEQTKKDDRRQ